MQARVENGREGEGKKWVEQESWIRSQSRQDMRKRSRTDYDTRRTNRRASDDCGMARFSHKRVLKQHQAGWPSIALLPGGIHAALLFILSSASTFQGGSEKHPRVNAGVRLSKQRPAGLWTIQDQSKRGCWTAASLNARHHDRGSCGGTAGEL
ncbi:hypothetical protein HDV63DRAFT_194209 [Trichoderma sp. SZMC 28014]